MIQRLLVGTFSVIALLASGAAQAQILDEKFQDKDWKVFTLEKDGKKTCYIASSPTSKAGNVEKRNDPYVLVTHRSAKVDEVSISAGYGYKAKSELLLNVDGKTHKLFTKDDLAWAYSEKQDTEIVGLMKKGKKFSAKGESESGSTTEDEYTLKGFSAAYKRMKELCK
jgi:hypothetical protein